MDRAKFYSVLRERKSGVFGTSLSQAQVGGIEGILDEGQKRGSRLPDLAYMLGTAYHETAATMQPIVERGQRSYFNKYEPGTPIGRSLGNTVPGDGFRFRGRGLPQLTGRRNYTLASKKLDFDFLAHPEMVMEPKYAIPIMFDGMSDGWFTAKSLSDYLDDVDESDAEDLREFINARRIVNGTDKADKIGRYALTFEGALRAAAYVGQKPQVLPPPKPAQSPPPPVVVSEGTTPKPSILKPSEPKTPDLGTTPKRGFWQAVLDYVLNRK